MDIGLVKQIVQLVLDIRLQLHTIIGRDLESNF